MFEYIIPVYSLILHEFDIEEKYYKVIFMIIKKIKNTHINYIVQFLYNTNIFLVQRILRYLRYHCFLWRHTLTLVFGSTMTKQWLAISGYSLKPTEFVV